MRVLLCDSLGEYRVRTKIGESDAITKIARLENAVSHEMEPWRLAYNLRCGDIGIGFQIKLRIEKRCWSKETVLMEDVLRIAVGHNMSLVHQKALAADFPNESIA